MKNHQAVNKLTQYKFRSDNVSKAVNKLTQDKFRSDNVSEEDTDQVARKRSEGDVQTFSVHVIFRQDLSGAVGLLLYVLGEP